MSGARREEIAALMVRDIKQENGVWFFDLDDNLNRRVKTASSRRKVPIHTGLIAHGFLDYVKSIKNKGQENLFPELCPQNSKDPFGRKLYYNFSNALKIALDGNPRKLSLHSFRHYVKQQLDGQPSVTGKTRRDILGHEASDVHDSAYGEATPIEELRRAIELLSFPISMTGQRGVVQYN
ncbi:Phage integrase family protein [Rhodobacteraceae bacterium THAF1]|uniref:hypothetical protein n=1 Tax=Palleronia sp. THAF1 TaxID=2587842 RepID=UPI000F3E78D1|nr:hypothetical protein [Palleronia sp. THAF1]QFU08842.1 Phage integrase family protein [Palleronia sp. THAF1]VDC31386.1 Phage integrase family protein [Rhodobacteraceae bacterium THAF1]